MLRVHLAVRGPAAPTTFGSRLRAARLRAGLTQSELAGDRYTKAFISALEHDQSRPSVPTLEYLAPRLGTSPTELLGEHDGRWDRLAADLHLAAGEWQAASDAYEDLLARDPAAPRRAELLRGLAEALSRLGRPAEAVPAATESAALFDRQGRRADAASARYWQASGLYWQENSGEARALLSGILEAIRDGLAVEPGFEPRVLIALAMIDGREGDPKRALTYLQEARGRLEELDDRRRAGFLQSLAISYREAGDFEGALTAGQEALAYFTMASSGLDMAVLENELALSHLARGSLRLATAHAAAAHECLVALADRTVLPHVFETQAAIALARDDLPAADRLAASAAGSASETGDTKALISALLTRGRIARRRGQSDEARRRFEEALEQARRHGRAAQVRTCLVELSDLAAAQGDPAAAYALAREALS